jgi:hypothetical protein
MGGRAVMNRNQGGYGYRIPQFAALGLALLLAGCGSTTKRWRGMTAGTISADRPTFDTAIRFLGARK